VKENTVPEGEKTDASKSPMTDTTNEKETETPPPKTPGLTPEEEKQLFEIDGGTLARYLGEDRYTEIKIPEGVQKIGKEAFRGNDTLVRVDLADSVLIIEESAFENCRNLKTLVLSDDLKEIRDLAFAGCENLEEVFWDHKLVYIGSKAFKDCVKIDREFATDVEKVEKDAFEGVPEKAPEPKDPQTPEKEPDPAPPAPEPIPNPYEEIEWEDFEWEEEPAAPVSSGRGSGKRQTHGRSRTKMTHDYDQVRVSLPPDAESSAMHTLTLDGETLELTLDGENGEERRFTVSLGAWESRDGEEGEPFTGTALILQAESVTDGTQTNSAEKNDPKGAYAGGETAKTAAACWHLNGAVLRKLEKSGVDYLVFRMGKQVVAAPTEGFLAGWAYDEMKSRGTAARRFDYTLKMQGEENAWTVSVQDEQYELGTDTLAPVYLTGVETGTEDTLRRAAASAGLPQ
jgi:hypothetical protein